MEPDTVPLFELNQTQETQVYWERIYGLPRQQINQPITTPECEPFPQLSVQSPFVPIKPDEDLDHHQVVT